MIACTHRHTGIDGLGPAKDGLGPAWGLIDVRELSELILLIDARWDNGLAMPMDILAEPAVAASGELTKSPARFAPPERADGTGMTSMGVKSFDGAMGARFDTLGFRSNALTRCDLSLPGRWGPNIETRRPA